MNKKDKQIVTSIIWINYALFILLFTALTFIDSPSDLPEYLAFSVLIIFVVLVILLVLVSKYRKAWKESLLIIKKSLHTDSVQDEALKFVLAAVTLALVDSTNTKEVLLKLVGLIVAVYLFHKKVNKYTIDMFE